MFRAFIITLSILTLLSMLSVPLVALLAEETHILSPVTHVTEFRFNNENWFTEPHPKVATFTMRNDGSAYGLTETGILFTQENVPNTTGIRIQKFVIQDHYHYIVEGEIVYTTAELSAKLAQAQEGSISMNI